MFVTFGIWLPENVRLRVDGEHVALWVNEELNENVHVSFRDRDGLRAFAAKINELLDKEKPNAS